MIVAVLALYAGMAEAATIELLRTFSTDPPIPVYTADAIEGLAWDGSNLWLAVKSSGMEPTMYCIRPYDARDGNAGEIIQSWEILNEEATSDPWGLAWDGNQLWIGFIPEGVCPYSTNGKVVESFIDLRGDHPGMTWTTGKEGLTWDGAAFWFTDMDRLVSLDPASGTHGHIFLSTWYGAQAAWDGEALLMLRGPAPPASIGPSSVLIRLPER